MDRMREDGASLLIKLYLADFTAKLHFPLHLICTILMATMNTSHWKGIIYLEMFTTETASLFDLLDHLSWRKSLYYQFFIILKERFSFFIFIFGITIFRISFCENSSVYLRSIRMRIIQLFFFKIIEQFLKLLKLLFLLFMNA